MSRHEIEIKKLSNENFIVYFDSHFTEIKSNLFPFIYDVSLKSDVYIGDDEKTKAVYELKKEPTLFAVRENQVVEYEGSLDDGIRVRNWILSHQYPLVRKVSHGNFESTFQNSNTERGIVVLLYNSLTTDANPLEEKFLKIASGLNKQYNKVSDPSHLLFGKYEVSFDPNSPKSLFDINNEELPAVLVLKPDVRL